MKIDLKSLEQALGYQYRDRDLLETALTHRSVGKNNYERLEFLGDSLLNFVAGRLLFENFPDASEGKLSRLRSALVRQETLADIARSLSLGDYLVLGPGELASGGFRRDSILSDVVESLIAACYLDAGFEAGQALVERLLSMPMSQLDINAAIKDPKTRLQEHRQAVHLPLPEYSVIEEVGPAHHRRFRVQCELTDQAPCIGEGSSRRKAEQASARMMLQQLGVVDA